MDDFNDKLNGYHKLKINDLTKTEYDNWDIFFKYLFLIKNNFA